MTIGARRASAAAIDEANGSSTWSRIGSNGRRACSAGSRQVWWMYSADPWSMRCSRRCQTMQVGVARRPVDVGGEASSQTMAAARSGSGAGPDRRREGQRAGQEVEPDVGPGRSLEQVLDLAVRLGLGEGGVELDQHLVRHGQPEVAGDLARQELRDQRLPAVPGAEQLDDVEPVVVGLDERRQRPALAQGRHVPGRGHGAEHERSVGPGVPRLCRASFGTIVAYATMTRAARTLGRDGDHQARWTPAIHDALDHSQTVDITTTGRRTGEPRRIEIALHNIRGRLVISGDAQPPDAGLDPQPRGRSELTVHLKGAGPRGSRGHRPRGHRPRGAPGAAGRRGPRLEPHRRRPDGGAFSPLIEVDDPRLPGRP